LFTTYVQPLILSNISIEKPFHSHDKNDNPKMEIVCHNYQKRKREKSLEFNKFFMLDKLFMIHWLALLYFPFKVQTARIIIELELAVGIFFSSSIKNLLRVSDKNSWKASELWRKGKLNTQQARNRWKIHVNVCWPDSCWFVTWFLNQNFMSSIRKLMHCWIPFQFIKTDQ
jgi:hypothetical protein